MDLILFGLKGCGKSYFGRLLADKMQYRFLDTDELILSSYPSQTNQKTSISEIYKTLGETSFRSLEKQLILSLTPQPQCVLALGGGAALDPENVKHLKALGPLVYLEASIDTLLKRILKEDLPAFLDQENPKESFLKIFEERAPIYTSIATHTIKIAEKDDATILAALRSILLLNGLSYGV